MVSSSHIKLSHHKLFSDSSYRWVIFLPANWDSPQFCTASHGVTLRFFSDGKTPLQTELSSGSSHRCSDCNLARVSSPKVRVVKHTLQSITKSDMQNISKVWTATAAEEQVLQTTETVHVFHSFAEG